MSDYHWRHLEDATVKARKEHRCFLCDLPITKGETYTRRRGVGDGELTVFAMHVACERETEQWTENDWRYHEPAEFREMLAASGIEGFGLTVVLPLPPKGASPNDRVVWQAKSHVKKKMREDAHAAALKAKGTGPRRGFPLSAADVRVTYYKASRRWRLDSDNAIASIKHYLDGIVDAGLLVDDNELTFLPVRQEIDKSDPRVEIELRRTEFNGSGT